MKKHQFRPALLDCLEERLVLSSSGETLRARAAQAVTRQAPGVDAAQIKFQVDQAFYWLQSSLYSGFFSLSNDYNYYYFGLPTDEATQRANVETLRVAASANIALLADQVGILIEPLRGSARLEGMIRESLTGSGPGSLASTIDTSLANIPLSYSIYNGIVSYSNSQPGQDACALLINAARVSTDNLLAAFTSGGANGRGSGAVGARALSRARGSIDRAFASFEADYTSNARNSLATLTFEPTYYTSDYPDYSERSAILEPFRRGNQLRVSRLVSDVDDAVSRLPGAKNRLQPYTRSVLGGLDRGSLLFSLNSLAQTLSFDTNPQVPTGTELPTPRAYSPTQFALDVGNSLVEMDRAATLGIISAYLASPGRRR